MGCHPVLEGFDSGISMHVELCVCVCLCVCRWQAESRCRRWSISNIRSNHNDQELDHHQTSTGQHILARGSPVCVCVCEHLDGRSFI